MRPANWFGLFLLCLIAGGVQTSRSLARHAHRGAPGPKQVVLKQEFRGYGLTPKEAEANALERACEWLDANAHLGWTPPPEFLREKGMVQFVGEPNEKEFEVVKDFVEGGKTQVVTMQLEITSDQYREFLKQARQEHMTSRHLLLARVLGGVVCLLIVVGGYLRLEEATKGYYTRLLRLAAITFLILAGVGLCVIA
jgi:hypothetical protein